MKFFCVEPEVAGELGDNTKIDRSVHPPIVNRLHYELDGWLGDALLESFPCFVVTEHAKECIRNASFTGTSFDRVEITTSDQFRELYPARELPAFAWFKVEGTPGQDDFGTTSDGRLIVSGRALDMLREIGIAHALITEFS